MDTGGSAAVAVPPAGGAAGGRGGAGGVRPSPGGAHYRRTRRGGGSGLGGEEAVDDIRLITVYPSTTLSKLMHKFVGSHVHRLYVVDKDTTPRPLAIITLTDVLRLAAGVW